MPDSPSLDCRSLDPLVTPYVDGELAGSERERVDGHLRVCRSCHSRVEAERAVHDLVGIRRGTLHGSGAPAGLHAACAQLARPNRSRQLVPPASRPSWQHRLAPLALAASLVLIVGAAFLYQLTARSPRVMAAELAADHMKCFAMNNVLGTHQDTMTVESSLLSGFGWTVHLPEQPERAELELVGTRPCLYGEGKVAHIMFLYQGRPVSLFMLPNDRRADAMIKVLGHQAMIWSEGQRTFVLIASGDPGADVDRIASFVRASMQ
jgi:anti-sigma factor RsiW